METKECPKCRMEYPITTEYFYKSKAYTHGFTCRCKNCIKKSGREYNKNNKEKRKESSRKLREKYRKINENRIYDPNIKHTCYICGNEYPMTEDYFGRHTTSKNGLRYMCKDCERSPEMRKKTALKNKYNLTLKEYNKMFDDQKNTCKICGCHETSKNKHGAIRLLAIDHDHKTGEIRGLLCNNCNTAIGLLKENPFIIIKSLKYIKGEI